MMTAQRRKLGVKRVLQAGAQRVHLHSHLRRLHLAGARHEIDEVRLRNPLTVRGEVTAECLLNHNRAEFVHDHATHREGRGRRGSLLSARRHEGVRAWSWTAFLF